jgi:hypothetical protein
VRSLDWGDPQLMTFVINSGYAFSGLWLVLTLPE